MRIALTLDDDVARELERQQRRARRPMKGVLKRLLGVVDRAKLVPDAHLAALAIEHGLTLMSTDANVARFSGPRWANPLEGGQAGEE